MKYNVLGVSSGLGVSLFPFKKHLLANVEFRGIFHTKNDEQWKANFGNIPLHKHPESTRPLPGEPDVIISSPDCGSGSIFRYSRSKKLGDHMKNDSLSLFFRLLDFYKCKFFLFENLENLFKSFPKEKFLELTKDYRLIIHNASVAHFGNSQKNRKRLIIVGIRRDIPKKYDKYFKLPHYKEPLTCGELYGDLNNGMGPGAECISPGVCHTREDFDTVISIHARKKMSLRQIAQVWGTRLKGKKRWETEPGFNFSTAPGVYRNLDNDFPATARKANRQFDEGGFTLTPRQLARIQGVPDDFKIYYDPSKPKYWINKGRCTVTKTPPMEISIWFKGKLEKVLRKMDPSHAYKER